MTRDDGAPVAASITSGSSRVTSMATGSSLVTIRVRAPLSITARVSWTRSSVNSRTAGSAGATTCPSITAVASRRPRRLRTRVISRESSRSRVTVSASASSRARRRRMARSPEIFRPPRAKTADAVAPDRMRSISAVRTIRPPSPWSTRARSRSAKETGRPLAISRERLPETTSRDSTPGRGTSTSTLEREASSGTRTSCPRYSSGTRSRRGDRRQGDLPGRGSRSPRGGRRRRRTGG